MKIDEETRMPHTIKPVQLSKIRVSPNAQRDVRPSRVDELLAEFDLDMLGHPVVNYRDGHYFVVDGQHRIEALKRWLGEGWEKQSIDCRVYSGMSERQEAEMFDRLNNALAVRTFDKFKVRVTAGRPTENAVRKVVEKAGLVISADKRENSISPVGTLVRVFQRSDDKTLSRTLSIVYQSFGQPGLTASVIDGVAHVCQRYNGALDDQVAIDSLSAMRGGVGALLSSAELLRKATHKPLAQCVAAATVDRLNSKRGGKKLPQWWTVDK